MRNWLIYEPPGGARATLEDVARFETVREGYSKAAFFLAPFWLAAFRCWIALGLWAAAMAVVLAVVAIFDIGGGLAALLVALPNLAIGFENAWIRARSLESRGFTLAGSVLGRTREEAEALFFADWLNTVGSSETARPAAAPSGTPYQPRPAAGVLGVFPEPRAAR